MFTIFTPTRPALALWWATIWRATVCLIMSLLPVALIYYALGAVYLALAPLMLSVSQYALIGLAVFAAFLPVILNNIVFPIIYFAGATLWLARKGIYKGRDTFTATYRGEPVTTFRQALKFSAFTYLEFVRYLWLFFIALALIIYLSLNPALLVITNILTVAFFAAATYAHMLALSDMLQRGTYSKNRCTLSFTQTETKA